MRYYLFAGFCFLAIHSAFSQSTSPAVLSTAGNSVQNGAVSVQQTIGEPLTDTYASGPNMLTQGFEQPVVSAVGLEEWEAAEIQLYPNPAQNTATVSVPAYTYSAYAIYDASGRLVAENSIGKTLFSFSVENFESGTYKLLLKGTIETQLTFIKL